MDDRTKTGMVLSIYLGTIVNVVLISLMTIVAELNPGFKNWLAATFSHHWLGKGAISVIVFVIIMLLFTPILKGREVRSLTKLSIVLVVLIIICFFAIGGFFLFHFLSG